MKRWSTEKISVTSLVLLISGSIDNIRNLPMTALFGSTLIFFFILAALIFLIPVALVAAELASTWPEEEGGVYSWVKHGLGDNMAFLTIWLQWVNTMVWYPTILLFIAGVLAYLINPALAEHKVYLITITLVIFWSLTLLGLQGLRASAVFAGFCAIAGMIVPMALLIGLALLWYVQGHPIAIDLSVKNLIPNSNQWQSWSSLTAMITSFLGMELAAVHVKHIKDPQRNFPRAICYSVLLILTTMILGSLAVAFVLPNEEMSLLQGVMQAFIPFLNAYHLSFLAPWVVIMLLIGSLGSMINWIISPTQGLLMAADHGFLPQWCYKLNRHGIASRILLVQALLVTLLCASYVVLPSVNAIYWLFSSLSTELYVLMYVLMFCAAIRLKHKYRTRARIFSIPGKQIGYYTTCVVGLLGCVISLVIGFFPPENTINMGGTEHFRLLFLSGIILMLLPAGFLLLRRQNSMDSTR
jgi:amino acid transporter